jgi:transcriptional regulator with XRE-family HTH domain
VETQDLKTLYMTNLKAVKDSLEKSVAKMATDLNMSARTINSYVTGERTVSLEFLTQICKIYNINANWFCTGEGSMFNKPKEPIKEEQMKQWFNDIIKEEFKKRGL